MLDVLFYVNQLFRIVSIHRIKVSHHFARCYSINKAWISRWDQKSFILFNSFSFVFYLRSVKEKGILHA